MKLSLKKIIPLSLFGILGGVALIPTTSAAKTCNGATSCAKYVVCPVGYSRIKHSGNRYHCETPPGPGATADPTCSRHNSRNDWRWSSGAKKCFRRKRNGDRVYSTANIECRSGYSYNATSGKCEQPRPARYQLPRLSSSASSQLPPQYSCSSGNACKRRVKCPSTFNLKTFGADRFYCKRSAGKSAFYSKPQL